MIYQDWENLLKKSNKKSNKKTKHKSYTQANNLAFLNYIVNNTAGKIIKYHFNIEPQKIHPGIIDIKSYNKDINKFNYGHLDVGGKIIRLSTCLDIENEFIQFPKEEFKFFEKGDYLYFTNGDLYLIINNEKLMTKFSQFRSTDHNNYEILIYNILDTVDYYGYIDWFVSKDVDSNNGIFNLNTIILDQKFIMTKLRGCKIGNKPKYLVARIEGSNYKNTFEYFTCVNLKDIRNKLKIYSPCKTDQGIRYKIIYNMKNFNNEIIVPIKQTKQKNFLLFDIRNGYDIDRIRKYCSKHEIKYITKTYRIDWAVKHAKYCHTTEEYLYHKEQFIKMIGIKKRYTEEDVKDYKMQING